MKLTFAYFTLSMIFHVKFSMQNVAFPAHTKSSPAKKTSQFRCSYCQ